MESQKHEKGTGNRVSPIIWVVTVAAALMIGVFAGIVYLKGSHNKTDSAGMAQNMPMGGGPQLGSGSDSTCGSGPKSMLMINGQQVESCGMPTMGKVTSISATSITVNSQDGSKTFSISANTKVSKKEGAATVSDITTNSRVAVISNDGSAADYIILNPPQQ